MLPVCFRCLLIFLLSLALCDLVWAAPIDSPAVASSNGGAHAQAVRDSSSDRQDSPSTSDNREFSGRRDLEIISTPEPSSVSLLLLVGTWALGSRRRGGRIPVAPQM